MARTDVKSLFKSWAEGIPEKILSVDISADDFVVPEQYRIIMVTVAGNVAVTMHDGTNAVLPALQPGSQIVFNAKVILQTGTTATGIKLLR